MTAGGLDALLINAGSGTLTITFIGTGLDILRADSAGGTDTYTVVIDGTSQGNLNTTGSASARVEKICSGLPYGTHTVKFTRTSAASYVVGFCKFIVYGPSKPAVPTGAVELAAYYVMANYVATTTGDPALAPISTGVLAKSVLREVVYTGSGWSVPAIAPSHMFGLYTATSTTNDAVQYTFFGIGIEIGLNVGTNYTMNVKIDGVNYTGAATISPAANGSWTPGTSTWVGNGAGNGTLLQISGLTLGVHTVLVTRTAGTGASSPEYVSIITPIHSPKSNLPGDLQNTLLVGSNSLGDSRLLPAQTVKPLSNWAQAVGVTSGPTTTSTTGVPMPDMICIIKTGGNPIEVSYSASVNNNTAGNATSVQVYVDGVSVGTDKRGVAASANYVALTSDSIIIPVAAGVHIVQLFWFVTSAIGQCDTTRRNLKVREL